MGEIGTELTRKIYPWNIKILYYDPIRKEGVESRFPGVAYVPRFDDMLDRADVVSLHLPLFPSTNHLVGENLLRLMKPNALLVNTARGPIIDIEMLIQLLEQGEIAINLAFDVYEEGPIPVSNAGAFQEYTFKTT